MLLQWERILGQRLGKVISLILLTLLPNLSVVFADSDVCYQMMPPSYSTNTQFIGGISLTTLNLNQNNHEGKWIDPDCFPNFLVIEEMKGSKKDRFEALQTAPPAWSSKAFRKAYERPINIDKHLLSDGYILIVSSNYGRSRSDYFDIFSYREDKEGTPVIQHLGREHPTFEGFDVTNRGDYVEINYKKYAEHHLDLDRINVSKKYSVMRELLRFTPWQQLQMRKNEL